MKRRPDAASRRPRVASRRPRRETRRETRGHRTPTPTPACHATPTTTIRFDVLFRRFDLLFRSIASIRLTVYPHTRKHTSTRRIANLERNLELDRSIDGVDRWHRSHRGFHRCTSSMKMSSSIDGGWMRSIEIRARRRRCDGATDEDARECACVCRDAPHVDVCLRRRSRRARRDGRSESRTRIARTRRTDRRTETRKDTVIVTRH